MREEAESLGNAVLQEHGEGKAGKAGQQGEEAAEAHAHHGLDAELVAHAAEEHGEADALQGEHGAGQEDMLAVDVPVDGQEQERGKEHALQGGEPDEHEYAARPQHHEVADEEQEYDELE